MLRMKLRDKQRKQKKHKRLEQVSLPREESTEVLIEAMVKRKKKLREKLSKEHQRNMSDLSARTLSCSQLTTLTLSQIPSLISVRSKAISILLQKTSTKSRFKFLYPFLMKMLRPLTLQSKFLKLTLKSSVLNSTGKVETQFISMINSIRLRTSMENSSMLHIDRLRNVTQSYYELINCLSLIIAKSLLIYHYF